MMVALKYFLFDQLGNWRLKLGWRARLFEFHSLKLVELLSVPYPTESDSLYRTVLGQIYWSSHRLDLNVRLDPKLVFQFSILSSIKLGYKDHRL